MPTLFCIMTWNLENLFRPGDPSGAGPHTESIYEKKLANLAGVIDAISPDVLAAQEIGDPVAFDDLNRKLRSPYPYVLTSQYHDDRGIRVGFLSRHPVTAQDDLSAFPTNALSEVMVYEKPKGSRRAADCDVTKMGRGALRIDIEIAGRPMRVVTAHLKSKLSTYPNGRRYPRDDHERARGAGVALIRRAAEAVALRSFVTGLVAGNNIPLVLLGDLNDEPQAITTQILLGPEDSNVSREDQGDDTRLYNLTDLIAPDRRYSRVYKKRRELIDHILVTRDLRLAATFVDSFVADTEPITESAENRQDKPMSDHAPIYARFTLP